jgi:hypothetical protein
MSGDPNNWARSLKRGKKGYLKGLLIAHRSLLIAKRETS